MLKSWEKQGIQKVVFKTFQTALEILGWSQDEARFPLEGRVLFTQPNDANWKKVWTVKMSPIQALLCVLSTEELPEVTSNKELIFPPDSSAIKDASLIMVREKNAKYTLVRVSLELYWNCLLIQLLVARIHFPWKIVSYVVNKIGMIASRSKNLSPRKLLCSRLVAKTLENIDIPEIPLFFSIGRRAWRHHDVVQNIAVLHSMPGRLEEKAEGIGKYHDWSQPCHCGSFNESRRSRRSRSFGWHNTSSRYSRTYWVDLICQKIAVIHSNSSS